MGDSLGRLSSGASEVNEDRTGDFTGMREKSSSHPKPPPEMERIGIGKMKRLT